MLAGCGDFEGALWVRLAFHVGEIGMPVAVVERMQPRCRLLTEQPAILWAAGRRSQTDQLVQDCALSR